MPAPTESLRIHILTNTWQTIDPRFGRQSACPVELDLGCGKGGLALAMAARFPDRVVVACDVMLGRLRRVANKAMLAALNNFEVIRANSLDLIAYQLPVQCITRIHLVCPDPWPKKRHRARRLVNTDFLRKVVRVLEPGGVLHLATDDEPYRERMLEAVGRVAELKMDPANDLIADIRDIKTEFEKRWNRQGIEVPHFSFIKQRLRGNGR